MIKVGLTGNIGSGKSTIAKIFKAFGVPVYHADKEAKNFLDYKKVQLELSNKFGDDVVENGLVNRKLLAQLVFNDDNQLRALNSIIHPLVKADLHEWFVKHADHSYVIQEAAILFESGFYKDFDKIITVVCPPELAIQRVVVRDGERQENIMERMRKQWSQEKKVTLSDYVIVNDGAKAVLPQVIKMHSILKDRKGFPA